MLDNSNHPALIKYVLHHSCDHFTTFPPIFTSTHHRTSTPPSPILCLGAGEISR
jgi:hypothetical protein